MVVESDQAKTEAIIPKVYRPASVWAESVSPTALTATSEDEIKTGLHRPIRSTSRPVSNCEPQAATRLMALYVVTDVVGSGDTKDEQRDKQAHRAPIAGGQVPNRQQQADFPATAQVDITGERTGGRPVGVCVAWKAGQHNEGQNDDTRGGGAGQMSRRRSYPRLSATGPASRLPAALPSVLLRKYPAEAHAHDARWSGAEQVALPARAAESERHSKADRERRQKIRGRP